MIINAAHLVLEAAGVAGGELVAPAYQEVAGGGVAAPPVAPLQELGVEPRHQEGSWSVDSHAHNRHHSTIVMKIDIHRQ